MDAKQKARLRQRQARARLARSAADAPPIPEVQQPPGLGTETPGTDIGRAYLQGAMLNYSDEALARMKAAGGLGEYEDLLDVERQRLERIPASTRIPAEMAGGALTMLGTAPGLAATLPGRAVSALPSIPRLAIAGGIEGGIAGAGAAEGGSAQRALGAAAGTGIGMAAGAATPFLTAPLRAGARAVGRGLGLTPGKQTQRALKRIGQKMAADEQTPGQFVRRAGRLPPDAPLVAAGQENMMSLARAVGQAPGPGRTIMERTMRRVGSGQLPRLFDLTARATGGRNYGSTLDEILKRRKAVAGRYYRRAFQNDPVLADPRLDALKDVDAIQGALKKARKAVSEPLTPDGDVVRLADLPEDSIQVWDQVYKQLGSAEHAARSSAKPNLAKARQVGILRNRLREVMTDLSPRYRDALDVFSQESDLKDALELGRKVLKPGSEISPDVISRLPEAEKQMFVVGVGRAMEDALSTVSDVSQMRNAVDKIFNNKLIRNRLAAGLPSLKAYQEFKKGILQEQVLLKTRRATAPSAGSQTALRALEAAEEGGSPEALRHLVEDVRTANVFGPTAAARSRGARILEGIGNRMTAGPAGAYPETARMLTLPVTEAANVARDVGTQMTAEELYRLMQLGIVGGVTPAGAREGQQAARTLLMP